MMMPSLYSSVERGREPGDMPPTSAWWARLAAEEVGVDGEVRESAFSALQASLSPAFSSSTWFRKTGETRGDVGQVGAAEVGIVEDDDVARLPVVEYGKGGGDAVGHCAEMGRDVRGLGDEPPGTVKERAGEVEAFFDIGRITCALEGDPHFLGYAAETMAVELECDGIGNHDEAVVSDQWSVVRNTGSWPLDFRRVIPALSPGEDAEAEEDEESGDAGPDPEAEEGAAEGPLRGEGVVDRLWVGQFVPFADTPRW